MLLLLYLPFLIVYILFIRLIYRHIYRFKEEVEVVVEVEGIGPQNNKKIQ